MQTIEPWPLRMPQLLSLRVGAARVKEGVGGRSKLRQAANGADATRLTEIVG